MAMQCVVLFTLTSCVFLLGLLHLTSKFGHEVKSEELSQHDLE